MTRVNISDLRFVKYEGTKLPPYFKFTKKDEDLVNFYNEDAKKFQNEKLTTVIDVYLNDKLIAYFAYTVSEIRRGEILPKHKLVPFPHPCLKLGRLLVCGSMRNKGVGTAILQDFATRALKLSEHVALRFLTVDAKPDALGFYKHFGFIDPSIKRGANKFLYIDLNKVPLLES